MIELSVTEITRYIKLSLLFEDDDDSNKSDYDNDMLVLIDFLKSKFIKVASFKIKHTVYFGTDIDTIFFKYTQRKDVSGTSVVIDGAISEHLKSRFFLSQKSIIDITEHWLVKRLGFTPGSFYFSDNLSRDVFIKLNK